MDIVLAVAFGLAMNLWERIMGIVEALGAVILALLGALGLSRWQLQRDRAKAIEQARQREHYGWAELERVRKAAEEASATADKKYQAPLDYQGKTDFPPTTGGCPPPTLQPPDEAAPGSSRLAKR